MSEGITAHDLAMLADVAEILQHSVDADEVPPNREWCYVDGPGAAAAVRDLQRRLAPLVREAAPRTRTPEDEA